jgi:GH15 family glucan-1,4-alpha-glucosidase
MSLELAIIGNSRIAALVDTAGEVVWMCVPGFDGDPVFCSLMQPACGGGRFGIDVEHCVSIEQAYLPNTAMLSTRMRDAAGAELEVIDFAPRFYQYGRLFAPVTLVRIVRALAGRPRIRVRFEPASDYGAEVAPLAFGSNHVRAVVPGYPLRLTTDAAVTRIVERQWFLLDGTVTMVLGPDEALAEAPGAAGRRMFEETQSYWHRWVRNLAVPFEWQDAVIRAAITLKLNAFDDTGAIAAAVTTSIPEAPGSGRNWDYRFCWLRDSYFVVDALNRLGATASMERFLDYLENLIAANPAAVLQPVYSLGGEPKLEERTVPGLAGYRSMGPVRVGNDAWRQVQNDAYGAAILGVAHAFFDRRLARPGDARLFERLERLGEQAWRLHDAPDAGIWEYRGRADVHTFSALMCWAACDRLALIAAHLGLEGRAGHWRARAEAVRATICERAWNPAVGAFASTFGGRALDASLLLMPRLRFLPTDDERIAGTVRAIGRQLRRGDFLLRYDGADDFGEPQTAFVVCAFWHIQALAAIGERTRARELFERVLARRNRFGLLPEDIDPATGELWGNFPQTYSMVGIIGCAMDLSERWEQVL